MTGDYEHIVLRLGARFTCERGVIDADQLNREAQQRFAAVVEWVAARLQRERVFLRNLGGSVAREPIAFRRLFWRLYFRVRG